MSSSSATAEALVLAGRTEVFAAVVAVDPPAFYPRFGPLPAVTSVSDQTGPFTVVGSSRRLHLSDGGHVTETVVEADDPAFHAYELRGFEKLFGRLVAGARAEWTFLAEAEGTRIRWTYTFTALPGRGAIVAAIVRLFWAPYMRRVLPPVAAEGGPLGE